VIITPFNKTLQKLIEKLSKGRLHGISENEGPRGD